MRGRICSNGFSMIFFDERPNMKQAILQVHELQMAFLFHVALIPPNLASQPAHAANHASALTPSISEQNRRTYWQLFVYSIGC